MSTYEATYEASYGYMWPTSYGYMSSALILLLLRPHTAVRVLILLYTCPHTAMYVSSYWYICVRQEMGLDEHLDRLSKAAAADAAAGPATSTATRMQHVLLYI
jgi:hypothetical protein